MFYFRYIIFLFDFCQGIFENFSFFLLKILLKYQYLLLQHPVKPRFSGKCSENPQEELRCSMKRMRKLKRIFALAGAVILAGMYLIVLILGLTASPAAKNMLMAAIACTVIIPCLLYGMMLLAHVLGNHWESDQEEDRPKSDKS